MVCKKLRQRCQPTQGEATDGQLQDSGRLSDDKSSALDKPKAKLIEPPVLGLPGCQGDYIVEKDA